MSSAIKQLENFAGVMNFVIFPMFFASSALYPLWRIEESSPLLYEICRVNPFTHVVELIRFALYGQFEHGIVGDRDRLRCFVSSHGNLLPTIRPRGCWAGALSRAKDDSMGPSNSVVSMITASVIALGAPRGSRSRRHQCGLAVRATEGCEADVGANVGRRARRRSHQMAR